MAAEDFKHTDSDEWDRFMAKTTDQKLSEIWANQRESNGHWIQAINDIWAEVRSQGREIQSARVYLSQHIEAKHPHIETNWFDQHQMMWFAFRVFVVLGPLSYAGLLAFLLHRSF